MPEIDLGPVIGPQGPKGDTGPQGEQGPQGPQGPAGKFDMDAGLTFTEASARANINSGESLKTILGKIKKYFTDLKPHAFKDPANNFTTTDATTAAAAPTVKQLKEDVDELNSALVETNGNLVYVNAASRDGSSFRKNFLNVDLHQPISEVNKNACFAKPAKDGDWSSFPDGLSLADGIWMGYREVIWLSDSHVMVRITEFYPVCGRLHFNFYNGASSWTGWKFITPS